MKVNEIISEAGLGSLALKGLGKLFGKSAGKTASKSAGKSAVKAAEKGAEAVAGKSASKVAAAATATSFMQKMSTTGNIVMYILGAVEMKNFLTEYFDLQQQKEEYDSGNTSTEIFGKMSSAEAEDLFSHKRDGIIGKAVVVGMPMLKVADKGWKFLSWITGGAGKIAGGLGGAAAGAGIGGLPGAVIGYGAGKAFGKLLGLPFGAASFLSKIMSGGVTGAAFMAFMASPLSKSFFENALTATILELIGASGRVAWEKATDAINEYSKTGSVAAAASTLFGKSDINKDQTGFKFLKSSTPLPPELQKIEDEYNKNPLVITFDRNNPKIIRANGQQITDEDGFQLVSDKTMKDLDHSANMLNKLNPLRSIPKKPGRVTG